MRTEFLAATPIERAGLCLPKRMPGSSPGMTKERRTYIASRTTTLAARAAPLWKRANEEVFAQALNAPEALHGR